MHLILKILLLFVVFIQSYAKQEYIKENTFNEVSYVRTFGDSSKDAIVFVHGLGEEASSIWIETAKKLQDNYYILIFDLPGFGKSDKSNKLYSPTNYAKFIFNITNHFINRPFHLVGHSMGASISLKYASMYANVKSLVLVDAAGLLNKVVYSKYLIEEKTKKITHNNSILGFISDLPRTLDNILPLEVDAILENKLSRKVFLSSNPNRIAAVSLLEEDFSNTFKTIDNNTLIIWGEKDKTAPLKTAYVLNKLIKNSKLVIFKNSAHVPIIDEPELFFQELKNHLNVNNYKKKSNPILKKEDTFIIENNNDLKINGYYYKKLIVKNSKNIRIENSTIEELIVENSSLDILNSSLLLKNSSFSNFIVNLTASSINLKDTILLNKGSLDIAGVDITSKANIFKVKKDSSSITINFSLSSKNGMNLHKTITLKAKEVY
ncbi:alpha/beta fold hydrolase [Malaciobacter mytili]|uniref:alpha/beta fold hydrolase n=1 Tax=Malaciobacter mytili TaxID=603050 RepID=UPI003A889385